MRRWFAAGLVQKTEGPKLVNSESPKRWALDIGLVALPIPSCSRIAKFRFGGRVKSSRDQLDLRAVRGMVLPSAAAIADISGFMK